MPPIARSCSLRRHPFGPWNRRFLAWGLVALCALPCLSAARDTAGLSLGEFAIRDQFDQVHTAGEFSRPVVVIVCSDRKGSEYNARWGEAIRLGLPVEALAQVDFVGLATLKGVPVFVKGMVKGMFPEDPKDWCLLDWKGVFLERFALTRDHCNVLVFGPDRGLRHHAAVTELDQEALGAVLKAIAEGLPSPATGSDGAEDPN